MIRVGIALTRWILPQRCAQCHAVAASRYCEGCLATWSLQPQRHLSDSGILIVSLSQYDATMKSVIHDIKFSGDRDLALQIGNCLVRVDVATVLPESDLAQWVVVPVPSVASRTAERGFHHVEVLFEALCDAWDIALIPAVIRSKDTQHLHTLGKKARSSETEDAFTVVFPEAIQDKYVLIVDDILTTGATLDAMAIALMRAGACSVQGLVLATGKRV